MAGIWLPNLPLLPSLTKQIFVIISSYCHTDHEQLDIWAKA